jgi:hypothetical protein
MTKLVWHCRLCLVMPDHLHSIVAFPREPGLKTAVSNWKKFVAVKHGVKWQRDFFDHRLRSNQELQEKTSYILINPVRKGLCERAEDWMWVHRPNARPLPLLGWGRATLLAPMFVRRTTFRGGQRTARPTTSTSVSPHVHLHLS